MNIGRKRFFRTNLTTRVNDRSNESLFIIVQMDRARYDFLQKMYRNGFSSFRKCTETVFHQSTFFWNSSSTFGLCLQPQVDGSSYLIALMNNKEEDKNQWLRLSKSSRQTLTFGFYTPQLVFTHLSPFIFSQNLNVQKLLPGVKRKFPTA